MASQPAGSSTHVVALAHFEAGRLTEAAAACHAILHRAPHDWLALRLLGHIRNSERAFDEAAPGCSPRPCRRHRRMLPT